MKLLFKGFAIVLLFSLNTCAKPDIGNDGITEVNTMTLDIPDGFDYSTHRSVKIKINDYSNAIYDIFITSSEPYFDGTQTYFDEVGEFVTEDVYRDDIINKLVLRGVAKNGLLEQKITLPRYCTHVYLRRKNGLRYSGELVSVINNQINYTYQDSVGRNNFGMNNLGMYNPWSAMTLECAQHLEV